jgi:hypothetical protein
MPNCENLSLGFLRGNIYSSPRTRATRPPQIYPPIASPQLAAISVGMTNPANKASGTIYYLVTIHV